MWLFTSFCFFLFVLCIKYFMSLPQGRVEVAVKGGRRCGRGGLQFLRRITANRKIIGLPYNILCGRVRGKANIISPRLASIISIRCHKALTGKHRFSGS